jgi:nitrite reductase/ring-hydroxylating ferredoxin subunit/predicted RNA binding protein YcfA (HicA-like mRNA interferase family)
MTTSEITEHVVAAADDLPPGGARAYAVGDTMVAVFRLRSGELRAVDAVCPHSGGPLADGQFDAKKVICPLHNYFFSLADGTCLNGEYAVRAYPVREGRGRSWSTRSGWHFSRTASAECASGYRSRPMAKAARVLAALKRDGWVEMRRSGSHRVLTKDDRQRIWAYHDGVDLGGPAMARIAKDYGYTLAELRNL